MISVTIIEIVQPANFTMANDDSSAVSSLGPQAAIFPTADTYVAVNTVAPPEKMNHRPRRRKRSLRACRVCRARKVRCNLVEHGSPCSNCRRDEIDCIETPNPRRSAGVAGSSRTISPRTNNAVDLEVDRNSSGYRFMKTPPGTPREYHNGMKICTDRLDKDETAMKTGDVESAEASPDPSTHEIPLCNRNCLESIMPGAFDPFPSHLTSADLASLESCDALTVPSKAIQVELLKAYIRGIHSTLPIIDIEELMTILGYREMVLGCKTVVCGANSGTSNKKISFLLFQAVLFAGVEYTSTEVLREAGFQDHGSAKRIFFQRVKLLYDFDTCRENLPIIQSLILMTLCPQSRKPFQKDCKDAWHWIGLAISTSFKIGLNRQVSEFRTTIHQRKLMRRIWWVLFIKDRTLSFDSNGTQLRFFRIRREDCETEMLHLRDFDLTSEKKHQTVESLISKKLAVDCVERAILCWKIGDGPALKRSTTSSIPSSQQLHIAGRGFCEVPLDLSSLYSGRLSSESTQGCPRRNSQSVKHYNFTTSPVCTVDYTAESFQPSQNRNNWSPAVAKTCGRPQNHKTSEYDVDGEYEDYLEYIRDAIDDQEPITKSLAPLIEKAQQVDVASFFDFLDLIH